MRLSRSTKVSLVALFLTACGSPPASRSNSASLACEAAATYVATVIAQAKSRPIVFATSDEPFSSSIVGGEWQKMDGDRPAAAAAQPAELVKRLQEFGNRNAVARCPSVRNLLDSQRIGYGSKAVDAMNKPNSQEMFEATIHTVSLPVVSSDGKQALLASSSVSGPLAGSGFLQLLEHQPGGKWDVTARSPLWVA